MKIKMLLKYFLCLNFIFITILPAKGQVIWDTLPYKSYADFKLQNLDKTIINSGILYDRMLPIADIERFKQLDQFTDTTGPRHWVQAYYELYHSAYNNLTWLSPDALESRLDTNAYVNAVPISVLNYKYNVMDSNAYVDDLIDTLQNGQFVDVTGRTRSPYFSQSTFIASPIISDNNIFVEGEDYIFYLDPRFFFYNDYIEVKQIRVDFGDGQGEWIVDNPFSGGSMQKTTSIFSSITKKMGKTMIGRIVVVGIDIAGHWIRYGNPFKILAKKKVDEYPLTPCKGGKDGGTKWVIDPDPAKLAPINTQYGNPPAVHNQIVRTGSGLFDFTIVPVKDTAYFFFKDDGNNCVNKVVRRPVIFIDGFDPSNGRRVGNIYKTFINRTVMRNGMQVRFGDYMLDNGNIDPNDDLDFIILDFKHGNDLLERNAMALVELIERLNQTYGSFYLQDITVIGPSMGSLIAQYALAYMEHNNIPHRVKTYISFDGCHQGANVPIGLQNYVEYITKRGVLKNVKSIREGLYNGLAAKQMLAHHHSSNSQFPAPDALRTLFLQNLAAVGEYPQLCRKVALINGTNNGTLNANHGTNSELLDIEIKRNGWKSVWGICEENICKKIKWVGRTATSSGTNKVAEMWTASPLYNVLFWVPLGKKNYYAQAAWGNSALDNAPGGLFGEAFSEDLETHGTFLAKELIYLLTGDKPSFNISINNFTMMPSYSAADLRFANKNLYLKWDDQFLCGKTPFDFVYAPSVNEEHVLVSEQGSKWFENEVRCNASDLPVFARLVGPDFFCTSQTYNLEICNASNLDVTWEVSPNRIVTMSPSGSQVTLAKRMNGIVTLTARTKCGNDILLSKKIYVGDQFSTIIGPYDINQHTIMGVAYTNTTYYFKAIETTPYFPALSYTWTLFPPTGFPTLYSGSQPYITFTEPGYHTLQVTKNTECGSVTSQITLEVQENWSGFSVMAAPNPAQEDVYITTEGESKEVQLLGKNETVTIALHDINTNNLIRVWNFKNDQSKYRINVSGVAKGVYILVVSKGKYKSSRQLLIQ